LAESAGLVFSKGKQPSGGGEEDVKALHARIGELTMERDFLERGLERIHGPKGKKWCEPPRVCRSPSLKGSIALTIPFHLLFSCSRLKGLSLTDKTGATPIGIFDPCLLIDRITKVYT